jgi:glycosyltransferase involved in cell wall biosynthesis
LAAADLFWAAFTHGRGSPLKLYEYMAMSRPVVVAGAGGSADPLEASRCGRALEKGDVEGLADAVVHYLHGETSELEAVGARGRAWVMANATWAHTARLMVLAMEKVVS